MIISGVVIHGRALGGKLGFPTANIIIDSSVVVDNGVYGSTVIVAGRSYEAISNVGVKPTVGGSDRMIESHIFDFSGDLYDQIIAVELGEKLRDEIHFESVAELREQIELDIKKIRNK